MLRNAGELRIESSFTRSRNVLIPGALRPLFSGRVLWFASSTASGVRTRHASGGRNERSGMIS
jgi:hypothetical protein